jgi:hypothetical protein
MNEKKTYHGQNDNPIIWASLPAPKKGVLVVPVVVIGDPSPPFVVVVIVASPIHPASRGSQRWWAGAVVVVSLSRCYSIIIRTYKSNKKH